MARQKKHPWIWAAGAAVGASSVANAALLYQGSFESPTYSGVIEGDDSWDDLSAGNNAYSSANGTGGTPIMNYSAGAGSTAISSIGGNQMMQLSGAKSAAEATVRSFAAQTGTIYFSMLYRFTDSAAPIDATQFMQIVFTEDNDSPNSLGMVMQNNSGVKFRAKIADDTHTNSTTSATTDVAGTTSGTTYFIVGKIDKGGPSTVTSGGDTYYDRIQLWINPTSNVEATPGGSTATVTRGDGNTLDNVGANNAFNGSETTTINTIFIGTGNAGALDTGDTFNLDNLRVGTTWSDVVASPTTISLTNGTPSGYVNRADGTTASDTNQTTAGSVSITGSGNNFLSEIDDLQNLGGVDDYDKASATLSQTMTGPVYAMLWLTGENSVTLENLRATLDALTGIDVYTSATLPSNPGELTNFNNLATNYSGWDLLVKFSGTAVPTGANSLNWDFAAQPGIQVDKVAVVPEPGTFAALGAVAMGMMTRRRRRA